MTNTPSDAEIEKLAAEHLKAFAQFTGAGDVWVEGEVAFARAVLAKWGTPQPAPAPLSDDTKRLDWLDRNIFSREMSEWDAKYGHGPDYNMWVVFSPKGVQGSARNIIDAAIAAQGGE